MATRSTNRGRNRRATASEVEQAAQELLQALARPQTPLRLHTEPEPSDGPEPGLYSGVSLAEYLAWPHLNHSLLQHGLRSMAHLKAAMDAPHEATAAQEFGTLFHAAALEPESLHERFAVLPAFEQDIRRPDGTAYEAPRQTKAYKEAVAAFQASNPGKVLVSAADWQRMEAALDALHAHDRARDYLSSGDSEVCIVWDDPETGIRCKARIDKLNRQAHRATDLKTTRDGSAFDQAISGYGYHRQAAFYLDGLAELTGREFEFCLVAVESAEPFGVRAAPVGRQSIDMGRAEYRRILRQVAECRETGVWPCYDSPAAWEVSFASEPLALSVSGELVLL